MPYYLPDRIYLTPWRTTHVSKKNNKGAMKLADTDDNRVLYRCRWFVKDNIVETTVCASTAHFARTFKEFHNDRP